MTELQLLVRNIVAKNENYTCITHATTYISLQGVTVTFKLSGKLERITIMYIYMCQRVDTVY